MPPVTAFLRRLGPLLLVLALASLASPASAQNAIISTGNNTLVGLNLATGADFTTFSSDLQLNSPGSLAFNPTGTSLFALNQGTGSILAFNAQTGAFESEFIAPGTGGLTSPGSIFFGPNGNLFVTDLNNSSILQFDATTGAFVNQFVAPGSGGLDNPSSIAVNQTGTSLFTLSQNTGDILAFNAQTGASQGTFITAGSGGLVSPIGLAVGPNGNLFVLDADNSRVLEFNGTTGAFVDEFIGAGSGLTNPTFLQFDQTTGNLFILDQGSNSVLEFEGTTGALVNTQALPVGAEFAQSFAFVPQGDGAGTTYIILNGFFAGAQVTVDDFDGSTVDPLLNQFTDASGTVTAAMVPGIIGSFSGTLGPAQIPVQAQVIAYDDAPNLVQALSDAVMSNLAALVANSGRLDPGQGVLDRLQAVQGHLNQSITALQLASSLTRNGSIRVLSLGTVQRINQINRLINQGLGNGRPNTNRIGQLLVLTQIQTQQAFRLAVQQTLGIRAR